MESWNLTSVRFEEDVVELQSRDGFIVRTFVRHVRALIDIQLLSQSHHYSSIVSVSSENIHAVKG
jgi:hypothetical protein